MLNRKNISLQHLFLVTIVLKATSSGLAWWLQSPLWLGFALPLFLMAVYVWLGWTRRSQDVSQEKFADSCYYLGFIFTITSIIFSLFDLPNIGTKMQDIAVRFGAAMVSTVVGLVVRVYLVSFKRDLSDAVKEAEEAVFDASLKFRDQLVLANERLRDFHSAVDTASKETVERVHTQVEAMARNYADKLTEFFEGLTARNQTAFTEALKEVRAATMRLAKAVDHYSDGMRANVGSVEARVLAFAEAVTERLEHTTFPADYFSQQLSQPLAQVREEAVALAAGVREASASVSRGSGLLGAALGKLRNQASHADEAMASVLRLTEQQQTVLQAAQGQLTTLERIETSLGRFDALLERITAELTASTGASSQAVVEMRGALEEVAATRAAFNTSSQAVAKGLEGNTAALKHVVQALVEAARTSDAVAARSRASIQATESVLRQLSDTAEGDKATAQSLQSFGTGTARVLERMEIVLTGMQGLLAQRSPNNGGSAGVAHAVGFRADGAVLPPPSAPGLASTTPLRSAPAPVPVTTAQPPLSTAPPSPASPDPALPPARNAAPAAVPVFTKLDPATVIAPLTGAAAAAATLAPALRNDLPASTSRPIAHPPLSARPAEPDSAA